MKAVVLGGGIAGLAAAHKLESLLPGAEVTLVEQSERVGGSVAHGTRGRFRHRGRA